MVRLLSNRCACEAIEFERPAGVSVFYSRDQSERPRPICPVMDISTSECAEVGLHTLRAPEAACGSAVASISNAPPFRSRTGNLHFALDSCGILQYCPLARPKTSVIAEVYSGHA